MWINYFAWEVVLGTCVCFMKDFIADLIRARIIYYRVKIDMRYIFLLTVE